MQNEINIFPTSLNAKFRLLQFIMYKQPGICVLHHNYVFILVYFQD